MTNIDDYMTLPEAAHRWGKTTNAIKERLKPSRNPEHLDDMIAEGKLKRFIAPGSKRATWIITREAMETWYGKENNK